MPVGLDFQRRGGRWKPALLLIGFLGLPPLWSSTGSLEAACMYPVAAQLELDHMCEGGIINTGQGGLEKV